jgi:erythromycin esterase
MTDRMRNLVAVIIAGAIVGGFYLYYFTAGSGSGAATYAPLTRPVHSSHLLTDLELAIDPEKATRAASTHAIPIHSLFSDDFSDLCAIDQAVAGKQFIFLGEASHGAAEFNWMKSRLIRYLHAHHGFEVVAFESSLMACASADAEVTRTTPRRTLYDCPWPVWHTTEVESLFAYIKAARSSATPLRIVGIDSQPSASGDKLFSVKAKRVLDEIDPTLAAQLQDAEKALSSRSADWTQLARTYGRVAEMLTVAHQNSSRASLLNATELNVIRQEAVMRTAFVRQMQAGGHTAEASRIRDKAMADNFAFVADKLHPGKKIIVWAHNAHISRVPVSTSVDSPMFSFLRADLKSKAMSVGLYMGSGAALMNNQQQYTIPEPKNGQLAADLRSLGWKYAWVDLQAGAAPQAAAAAPDWARQKRDYRDWGITPIPVVLADAFDAIIYIGRVTPAEMIRAGGK